ncbi:hypothetical protein M1146_06650 [Patescibacteria group bacterium]|nr:hypothetical protein [Patescibacteria group bacterium]
MYTLFKKPDFHNGEQVNGDTSSVECAHELGKLCENRNVIVNLIPYNPILSEADTHDPLLTLPSHERIMEFQRIVQSYGCFCFVRKTMGQDISGACGQLAVQQQTLNATQTKVQDIEDVLLSDKEKLNNSNRKKAKETHRSTKVAAICATNNDSKDDTASAVIDDLDKEVKPVVEELVEQDSHSNGYLKNPEQKSAISETGNACYYDVQDLSRWIFPLAIATSVSFTCFALSGMILLTTRGKK